MKARFTLFLFLLLLLLPVSAFARDTWISVRSKNFLLIGNASEKEIRQVATRLEQFRETFHKLFPKNKFDSPIQTNVVVFKNQSSYNPFRPKRADGKPDTAIAGYFQSGEDVNYITLSTEGEKIDTYETIFHEYVHFMLNTHFGKSEIPTWFNEGLAEYYSTFQIQDDQKVILGNLKDEHLMLLQQNQLIPLRTLFQIDNYSLHRNGDDPRSMFYAQSWALIHYLIQGNNQSNAENLSKFLGLIMNKTEPEKAFQQVFGYDYSTMEEALKKYVSQRKFQATMFTANQKMVFDTDMVTAPLSDTEANAYLGDLLTHTHEYSDAEGYLQKSLTADPDQAMANASMGLAKMHEKKFDEAKTYLEKAMASGKGSHFAYYNYAYTLNREEEDSEGFVRGFLPDKAKKMRDALQKAIQLNPNYSDTYTLLAFIDIVNDENLDEALQYLKKGLTLEPGDQQDILYIAQIFLRQKKFNDARAIAQNLLKTADEPWIHAGAEGLLNSIAQYEAIEARNQQLQKQYESQGGPPSASRGIVVPDTPENPEEDKKMRELYALGQMNAQLKKPGDDEKQIIGSIQKVACANGNVTYSVASGGETFLLTSKAFQSLDLLSLVPEAEDLSFGCNTNVQNFMAVMIYKPSKDAKVRGTLLSVAFVPKTFKLKTEQEITDEENKLAGGTSKAETSPAISLDPAMLRQIAVSLRKPEAGEQRELATVDKIECVKDQMVFIIKTDSGPLRLSAQPGNLIMNAFGIDMSRVQMGCGVKPPDIPAVVTYKAGTDPKAKENGEIVSIEFVPKGFKI
jgi:tetratricopeptide (TPR) repeat protein